MRAALRVALGLVFMAGGCSAPGQQGQETANRAHEPVASASPRDAGFAPPPPSPEAGAPACAPVQVAVPALISHELDVPLPALQDPQHNLAPFHRAAIEFLRGDRTHLRIGFYGDSNMTREFVSGPLRRTLQLAHGDGGHGYIAAGKAWRWYDHWDVTLHHQGGWDFFTPSTKAAKRPLYGHAGIRFDTRDRKALSRVTTAEAGAVGKTASRFGAFYLTRKGGGSFELVVDGTVEQVVETSATDTRVAYAEVSTRDAPHRFELRGPEKRRLVSILGLVIERDQGIVIDSLGIGGVAWLDLASMDEATQVEMLRLRKYDLVIYLLGTNFYGIRKNPASIARVIEMQRRARADIPILLLSPPDHVKNRFDVRSTPQIVKVAEQTRQAAETAGVAFWDFRAAMGGEASMARFARAGLASGDLYHFSPKGGAYMSRKLSHTLWQGVAQHAQRVECTP